MSSRGGTVTLVYDSPISFSGQYAATALIRDTLADSDWTFQAVEYPALDRTAGKVTRYAHLSRAADGIREGSLVRRGQTVAYSGNTGLSTAPHLHYEVRLLNEERTPINPVSTFVPDVTPAQYRELVEAARSQTISFD